MPFSVIGTVVAVLVDLLLLLIALPLVVARVALRAARSYLSLGFHRLSGWTATGERRSRRAGALAALTAPPTPAHVSLGQSACSIAAALRNGAYTSVQCTRAFIAQARVSARARARTHA